LMGHRAQVPGEKHDVADALSGKMHKNVI